MRCAEWKRRPIAVVSRRIAAATASRRGVRSGQDDAGALLLHHRRHEPASRRRQHGVERVCVGPACAVDRRRDLDHLVARR
jgi:hypothetical protein